MLLPVDNFNFMPRINVWFINPDKYLPTIWV